MKLKKKYRKDKNKNDTQMRHQKYEIENFNVRIM